jgi:ABC-type transport system involved in cytochrome c biogenesis permease component
MLFADYMPMPWWFLPLLFAPVWVPVLVFAALAAKSKKKRDDR